MNHNPRLFLITVMVIFLLAVPAHSQEDILNVCPAAGIALRGASYEPGGIILTTFDRANLWVYDIDRDRRYPLPDTFPCPGNCRLSPDARWLLYFNDLTNAYNKMRIDGTQRSLVSEYAGQVEWWSADTWLVWTPGRQAYLMRDGSTDREYLDVRGVISIQPGGRWGLEVESDGDGFRRALVDLTARQQRVELGTALAYFDDSAWSPDGATFAYVAPVLTDGSETPLGSELYLVSPNGGEPTQVTHLTDDYGLTRINGLASGALSWSPDSRKIAFWVVGMAGSDPETDGANASIYVFDVETHALSTYCGFSTTAHTPNPPRMVWSPDSTHLAFGADIPNDERANLLLALDINTGVFTILSEGIYPALGIPAVTAWGLPPG